MKIKKKLSKELRQTLINIQLDIEKQGKLWSLNLGGCGFMAGFIKKELEDRNIISLFVYMDRDFNNKEEIINNLNSKNLKVSCSHVMLNIGRLFYDSKTLKNHILVRINNFFENRYNIIMFSMLSGDYVKKALNEKSEWNGTYNRKICNPLLKKIIKKNFKEYDELIKHNCIN